MRSLNSVLVVAVSCLVVACGGKDATSSDDGQNLTGSDNTMITLKGIVYGRANTGSGCTPACSFVDPLPNAEVGTSLDGVKVTTDSNGRFTLTTQTKSSSKCLEFMVNITAVGYTPYHIAGAWGNQSERNFAMAPPVPTAVGSC